jgi:L-iditol 2-dehydrogenase
MPSRTIATTMKAAVYHGANDLRVEPVPVPRIGPGDVLVRVAVCGVSTGDVRRVQMGLPPFPRILGDETAGTIEAIGDDVDGWRVGDRVVVHGTESDEASGGGFAEFVRVGADDVDEGGIVEVPRDVPFEEAIFLEPVNTCLRGIRLLDLDEDDVVLVAGVGSLGLILQQLAIREGARVVAADPLPGRLALAKSLGAERVVDPKKEDMHEACRALTKGRGADAAIVAAIGAGPVRDAIKATRRRAKILLFGQVAKGEETAVDVGDVCLDEKHLIGSHAWSEDEADEADEVVFRREIELARLITHRFPLDQAVEAFRKAGDRGNDVGKVVLLPGGEEPPPSRKSR